MPNRRSFLAGIAVGGIALHPAIAAPQEKQQRRFTLDLRTGSIGVQAGFREAMTLAEKHGFESITPNPKFLAGLDRGQLDALRQQLREKELKWGSAGLPVDFRNDESAFRNSLQNLPRVAERLQKAGVERMGTYIRPAHKELTYRANFRSHVNRLRQCASVLNDHGLRFGLEYVGPKTSWTSQRHSFIHTMAETRELIAEIGTGNVGLILDSWHWYTAHETIEDLAELTNDDVVACDLNDAPAGIEVDQQIDNRRELPAATGVINLRGFLGALVAMQFDGPVRAEPFNQQLNAMDNETACAATARAMRKAFALLE